MEINRIKLYLKLLNLKNNIVDHQLLLGKR
jgi:hypothetical protein